VLEKFGTIANKSKNFHSLIKLYDEKNAADTLSEFLEKNKPK